MKTNLKKQVFDKDKFNDTINNSFTQLNSSPDLSFFDPNLASVDDLFYMYNKLFYEIPKDGETNSHEYLYKTCRDYVGFEELNDQIQALLEEITTLREENLKQDEQILELLTKDVDNKEIKAVKAVKAVKVKSNIKKLKSRRQ